MKEIKRFFRRFFNAPLIDIILYLLITVTAISFFSWYTTVAYTHCVIAPTVSNKVFIVFIWHLVNVLYVLFVKALLYIISLALEENEYEKNKKNNQ